MDMVDEKEIVIVGGGISGLATALALHRKGIRSLVLERSESLRETGAGIGILANGWRALEQLGVASKLRQTALPIQGGRIIWLDSGKQREAPISKGETRCLKRSDLIQTLAVELPHDTIHFGCQIISVELDKLTSCPVLQMHDGSTIKAKVVIGCDGANSVIGDYLEVKPNKLFSKCAARGFTYYPNGHGLAPEFIRLIKGPVMSGRIPVTDKLVYWFIGCQGYPKDSKVPKDPELIRQFTLESVKGFPTETMEMINDSDLNSLSLTYVRYRAPWDILLGSFRKGNVIVAGDAMHVMGPFLGQGGSAGVEDAIVLARCLAQKSHEVELDTSGRRRRKLMLQKVGEAMDEFVKERRMRLVWLSAQTYLTGLLLETSSFLEKLFIIIIMALLFRDPSSHTLYDCGCL